jgi:hypothetical protein
MSGFLMNQMGAKESGKMMLAETTQTEGIPLLLEVVL